ncbi:MAG: tetratricopeptide repeat protein, partial [Methanoregula sp.]
ELITYDRILEKYGQSENQELQIAVAKSMYNKGQSLEKIGDHRSAKELYNEILKKFRKSKEKTIRSILRTIKKKGA